MNQFSRTQLLFGKEAMNKIASCHIAIFGIGGVGGYTAEALARSGVGKLTLVDDDRICLTNINRQIFATRKTVGQFKTDAAEERLKDINTNIEIIKQKCFYTPDNADDFDLSQYDYIVDAVDTVSAKLALAENAQKAAVPIISCMGAGNKLDPTRFEVADIYETSVCPLAKVMRYECRKRGIKKLKCVYSKEPAMKPIEDDENSCKHHCICPPDTKRTCEIRRQVPGNVKILLFCSPHNPVGRVWKREELERVTRICLKHNVIIISDEIHSDLVYKKHIPTASLSDEVANITIALTSITKTFNLAGIQGANLIIPNERIRAAVENELRAQCAGGPNIMSLAATKAAYQYGDKWLDELLVYLTRNIDYVIRSFEGTEIKPLTPQGTYLMWLDCRALGLNDRELEDFFIKKCGVWMNGGCIFGKGGSGFMRMNVACPRKTLEEAVFRIKSQIKENKYE